MSLSLSVGLLRSTVFIPVIPPPLLLLATYTPSTFFFLAVLFCLFPLPIPKRSSSPCPLPPACLLTCVSFCDPLSCFRALAVLFLLRRFSFPPRHTHTAQTVSHSYSPFPPLRCWEQCGSEFNLLYLRCRCRCRCFSCLSAFAAAAAAAGHQAKSQRGEVGGGASREGIKRENQEKESQFLFRFPLISKSNHSHGPENRETIKLFMFLFLFS